MSKFDEYFYKFLLDYLQLIDLDFMKGWNSRWIEESNQYEKIGNFLENEFWTPPPSRGPLLSILYMHLIFITWIKLVIRGRSTRPPSRSALPLACPSRSARLPSPRRFSLLMNSSHQFLRQGRLWSVAKPWA